MNKFWTQYYPEGVATDLEPSEKTLIQFFTEQLNEFADRDFISNMGVTYTYAQVDAISLQIASWIQSTGLAKGSTIGLMMPNVNQYLPVVIGALRAGMVLTMINPLYTSRELKHQLVDSDAKMLFILEPFCHTLEVIVNQTAVETVVVSKIGDMLGTPKGQIVNFVAKYLKKAVPAYKLKSDSHHKVISFKAVMNKGKRLPYSNPAIKADDLAMIQYTGGTTGVAKGILISHRNIVFATSQYNEWFNAINIEEVGDEQITNIIALPLYHIFAFIMSMVGIAKGQYLSLVTNPRDIDGFIKILKERPFHMLPAVNTLFHALLMHPNFDSIDFSSLRLSLAGGMAATPEMAKNWYEKTGVSIIEGWGMSETIGAGAANPLTNTEFSGTIGMPLPGVEMQIRDEDDNVLEIGEIGEICIKGANVISGYHNLDNSQYFTKDGYLKTGDIGSISEKGYVKLYDRKKDMLIVSGFNVFPNEVENVLETHPKVLECAVVGVDDDLRGQAVKAFVVKSDDSLSEQEVIEFCKEQMAGYKRPRHVEFIDELPKSTVGKILRHELRNKGQNKEVISA